MRLWAQSGQEFRRFRYPATWGLQLRAKAFARCSCPVSSSKLGPRHDRERGMTPPRPAPGHFCLAYAFEAWFDIISGMAREGASFRAIASEKTKLSIARSIY